MDESGRLRREAGLKLSATATAPLPYVGCHEGPRGPRVKRDVCRQTEQREMQGVELGLSGFHWLLAFFSVKMEH